MRGNLIVIILIMIFNQLSFCQEKKVYDDGYYVKVGDTAPDFTIHETGGLTYRLSDLKGK